MVLIKAVGSWTQLTALPTTPGVLLEDHGIRQIDRDSWSVTTYVTSRDVIDVLRSQGVKVEVLLSEEEIQARGRQIAREAQGNGK